MSGLPSPALIDLSDQVTFETGSRQTGIGLIAPFDFVLDREYWEPLKRELERLRHQ